MTASCTADSAAVCKVGVEMVESNFFLRILFARYRGTKTTTTESHVGHLLESYNEAFDKGKMSISQRRGIISLIPKGENYLVELTNWRPITLLNFDYTMLARAFAKRIEYGSDDFTKTNFLKL